MDPVQDDGGERHRGRGRGCLEAADAEGRGPPGRGLPGPRHRLGALRPLLQALAAHEGPGHRRRAEAAELRRGGRRGGPPDPLPRAPGRREGRPVLHAGREARGLLLPPRGRGHGLRREGAGRVRRHHAPGPQARDDARGGPPRAGRLRPGRLALQAHAGVPRAAQHLLDDPAGRAARAGALADLRDPARPGRLPPPRLEAGAAHPGPEGPEPHLVPVLRQRPAGRRRRAPGGPPPRGLRRPPLRGEVAPALRAPGGGRLGPAPPHIPPRVRRRGLRDPPGPGLRAPGAGRALRRPRLVRPGRRPRRRDRQGVPGLRRRGPHGQELRVPGDAAHRGADGEHVGDRHAVHLHRAADLLDEVVLRCPRGLDRMRRRGTGEPGGAHSHSAPARRASPVCARVRVRARECVKWITWNMEISFQCFVDPDFRRLRARRALPHRALTQVRAKLHTLLCFCDHGILEF
mmetsp:Transcript_76718/g.216987  ORF Transcript_76718/g.216987 Transcript_76718/m.216987 type:complete len:461 (+) Transcript_76718:352-1734(+)